MEPQQHPLQTATVLHHLFTLAPMTFKDFKNVRLVCHAWYGESLSLWRKAVVLTLHEASRGIQPNTLIAEIQIPDPKSIIRLREKPYDKYKLCDLTLDFVHLKDSSADAAEFWTVVGPFVRHLTLENVKWVGCSDDLSPSSLFGFFRNRMPYLQHLALSSEKLVQEVFQRGSKVEKRIGLPGVTSLSLTKRREFYLSDFPNLTTLRLDGGADFVSTSESREEQSLVVNNSSVTRLELGWVYDYNTVFSVRFTALKHLEMVMNDESEPKNVFVLERFNRRNNFLQAHLNQLERCNLIQWNLTLQPTVCPFTAELPNLTEVRLWGNVVADLSFVRYMPNLKLLHVDVLNVGRQRQLRKLMRYNRRLEHTLAREVERDLVEGAVEKGVMVGVTLPHLTSLFLSCRLFSGSVQALGEWMPNLKVFKAVLNASTLQIVLEQWSGLTLVHCLIGSRLKDTDLPKIIPLMYDLQSFRYSSACGNSGFSNAKEFLDLSALVSLKLCVSQHFPEETEIELKKKIPHVEIYKNYPGNPQHRNWKCCRFSEYKVDFLRHIQQTTWTPMQSIPVGSKHPLIPDYLFG